MYITDERFYSLVQRRNTERKYDFSQRDCLRCRKSFRSMGDGHRICAECKGSGRSKHQFDDARDYMLPNTGIDKLRATLDN